MLKQAKVFTMFSLLLNFSFLGSEIHFYSTQFTDLFIFAYFYCVNSFLGKDIVIIW